MYRISVITSSDECDLLDNLLHHCYDENEGMVYGFIEIKEVVSDSDGPALDLAEKKYNLTARCCERLDAPSDEEWSEFLLTGDKHDVDLYVLVNFKSKLVIPDHLKGKVVDLYPTMLPAHYQPGEYGLAIHEAVVAAKESFTGTSVYTVENNTDDSVVLAQIKVGILPWDSAADVQVAVDDMGKRLYPRAILNYLRQLKAK